MANEKELAAILHFYQPQREGLGLDVVPYINERIYRESYWPLLVAPEKIQDGVTFSLYAPLREWMMRHHPADFAQLKRKIARLPDREYRVLGDPLIHTILPFGDARDVEILVRAGKRAFLEDLGFSPAGMWLPETAVNFQTLRVLADNGYQYVPMMDHQVRGWDSNPVQVPLGNNRKIVVVGVSSAWSNLMAFHPEEYYNGDDFLERVRNGGQGEVIFGNDGETFGHHHHDKAAFINYAMRADVMSRHGVKVVDIQARIQANRLAKTEIFERTAWSCPHQLGRWTGECGCDGASEAAREMKARLYNELMGYKSWIKEELDRLAPNWMSWYPDLMATNRHYVFGSTKVNQIEYLAESREVKNLCLGLTMVYVGMTSCGWFFGGDNSVERQIPEKMLDQLNKMFGRS